MGGTLGDRLDHHAAPSRGSGSCRSSSAVLTAPWHDRHARYRALRRAVYDLVADREVDERVPFLVDDAINPRVLEKHRGALGIYRFPIGQLAEIDGNRPGLAAGERKSRRVFREAQ